MLQQMVEFLLDRFMKMGYTGIIVLMGVQSSFIPFPSEVVIPPAAYLASQGQMNVYLVILCGIIGSILGSLTNYFLAKYLGRSVVYRLADTKLLRLMMINSSKIEKSEAYFNKYGNISIFICTLIPGVRQLISIPAGIAKMNLGNFIFFTALGAGIWTSILAVLGFYFGENQELILAYSKEISIIILLIIIISLSLIIIKYKKKKKMLYK